MRRSRITKPDTRTCTILCEKGQRSRKNESSVCLHSSCWHGGRGWGRGGTWRRAFSSSSYIWTLAPTCWGWRGEGPSSCINSAPLCSACRHHFYSHQPAGHTLSGHASSGHAPTRDHHNAAGHWRTREKHGGRGGHEGQREEEGCNRRDGAKRNNGDYTPENHQQLWLCVLTSPPLSLSDGILHPARLMKRMKVTDWVPLQPLASPN